MSGDPEVVVIGAGPNGLVAACTLGRSGIAVEKREGDGVTPSGRFPVRRVMYRPDRGPAPRTAIDLVAIDRLDYSKGIPNRFEACEEMLRTHPHVDRFEAAPQSAGGRGVTIVTLRT